MNSGVGKRLLNVAALAIALEVLFSLSLLISPPAAIAASPPHAALSPTCFCSADFNHDGLADHGTISSIQGSTLIRLSLTGLDEPLSLVAGTEVVGVAAADVDLDGDADLVALKRNLRVKVWLNNGRGEFVRQKYPLLSSSIGDGSISPRDGELPASSVCATPGEIKVQVPRVIRHFIPGSQTQAEALASEVLNRSVEDPSLSSIHPRGPPSSLSQR